MRSTPNMIDMKNTPAEKKEMITSMVGPCAPDAPEYPWGLSISLNDESIKKLKLDISGLTIGGIVHLFAFAKVTSISQNDNEGGSNCRVELQITHLAGEDEDEENAKSPKKGVGKRVKSLYEAGDKA